jgi:molybdate/tungstate transport system substrate-binding protein
MKIPRWLLVCAIIAGWLAVPAGSRAQDGRVLHVALAGTMEQVMSRQIGPAFMAATGYKLDITRQSSVLLANRIASGELKPDVYISSDANVMELVMGPANNDRARWYLPLLRSRTVIMHGTQGRFYNDIEAVRAGKLRWYELMQRPGLVLKRPNPTIDAGGYRAIFVFDLAERFYNLPGLKQRALGTDDNESQYFDRRLSANPRRKYRRFRDLHHEPIGRGISVSRSSRRSRSEQPVDAELVCNRQLH